MDMPKKPVAESPLYVKLPPSAIDKLHRAAEALGVAKKDLVAGLVNRYVDPDSRDGMSQLSTFGKPEGGPMMGNYSFRAYDPPEVLNVEQAAQLLQIEERIVIQLAEAGELPGRRLGYLWRFSRAALVAWLAGDKK